MFVVVFKSSILASFSKFLSGKLQKREVFAWSTYGKPSNKYPQMTTKTIRRRSTKQKENTSRIRMDVIPPPSSPPLHRTTTYSRRRRSTKQKENTSRIRMDVITPPTPPPPHHYTAPQHSRRRWSTKEKENSSRSRMDVITPPPRPIPPPKPPHRVERQMKVEAGMCRKSRDGQNTAKTDAKCDTTGKHRKKRCEMES